MGTTIQDEIEWEYSQTISISILPKVIYKYNAISIKNTNDILYKNWNKISNICATKRLQIVKAILSLKKKTGGNTLSDVKIYYNAKKFEYSYHKEMASVWGDRCDLIITQCTYVSKYHIVSLNM